MRVWTKTFVLLLILLVCSSHVRGAAPWGQSGSPYRAIYKIKSAPDHPSLGILLRVPVSGLASKDGNDIAVFDQEGRRLKCTSLGAGRRNSSLVLAEPRSQTRRLYAYFGSGMSASQSGMGLRPSLILNVRSCPKGKVDSWADAEKLLQKSASLAHLPVDNIQLSHNPVDARNAVILVFDGYLKVPRTRKYAFFLVNTGAGFVFIDGEKLITQTGDVSTGAMRRGKNRQDIRLKSGAHRIRVVIVNRNRRLYAVLGRWQGKKDKHTVSAERFLHSGRGKLVKVESRFSHRKCPAFDYDILSYVNYQGTNLTEVEVHSLNGKPNLWQFEDGRRAKGEKIRHIVAGLEPIKVRAGQGDARASGIIRFPEKPPQRYKVKNNQHYRHYADIIKKANMKNLRLSALQGYRHFFSYREYNSDLVPVCEAILGHERKLKSGTRLNVLIDLARAASRKRHKKAIQVYKQAVQRSGQRKKQLLLAREYAEFVIFGAREFKLAEEIIGAVRRHEKGNDLTAALLQFDLLLQQGEEKEASEMLDKFHRADSIMAKQRRAAIRTNALRERFYKLLGRGFLQKARDTLWEWQRLAPYKRGQGSIALAQARLWGRLGWDKGALAALNGAMMLNNLLPNLPKVEMEKARIYRRLGQNKKARKLLKKIREEYPNHPVAEKAKKLL